MRFEEFLKLENSKAHYEAVMGNLRVANEQLEDVLRQKETALGELEKVNKSIGEAKKELVKQADKISAESVGLSKKEATIKQAQIDLQKEKKAFEDSSDAERKNQKRMLSEIENLVSIKRGEVSALQEQIEPLTSLVKELTVKKNTAEVSLKEETERLNLVRAEYSTLVTTKGDELVSLTKQIAEEKKTLAELVSKRIEAEGKVVDADRHFASKEKELDRREKDILIITRRLKDLYAEVAPGVALKI